ncbi:hypothetical protein DH2020_002823 [Rehmannia glutinosa]|uniref:Endonuclease/exonuclease/phosphatase domain-containing protein n=1 Tax=Rehmannia glutinosa TaxID=99300 RepID=A0ABR0XUU6_REHGL
MNCLAWNCQGLGLPRTVRAFGEILQEQKPDVVFLMETKLNNIQMDCIKERFNFFGVNIAAIGKSGGLALLWKKDIRVDIQTYSHNHIDAIVFNDSESKPWRFTGCYGEPVQTHRHRTWALLKWLSNKSTLPWLCIGDFNEILHKSEKQGGDVVPNWRIQNFRQATLEAGLVNIGFSGYPFTWTNRRQNPNTIWARLDRAFACSKWNQQFPKARWCETHEDIEKLAINYFTKLFKSGDPTKDYLEIALNAIEARASYGMNQHLLSDFTREEVTKALFQMYPLKSPGPDGFPALFYQKFWNIVGDDVIKTTLDFLNCGILDNDLNRTHIVLLPKFKSPEHISQFRPISLTNVIFKILAKTLANRLKPHMPTLIVETQSAFVLNRLITDNVLIAFEINHFLKHYKNKSVSYMALKWI